MKEVKEQHSKGLFGSIVESVLTPGATEFDIGVINFAFISLILLLILIFFVTDRAKIHVACFLILAIVTYGIIIYYLYVKDYEEEKEKENEKEKKVVKKVVSKKATPKSNVNTQSAKVAKSTNNKNKKKKIY